MDEAWVKHISDMDMLREGIGLRGYSQSDPLQAYALEGHKTFEEMQDNIDRSVAIFCARMEVRQNFAARPVTKAEGQTDGKEAAKKKPTVKGNKIKRNDPCPCGSGKKYKQCCGK